MALVLAATALSLPLTARDASARPRRHRRHEARIAFYLADYGNVKEASREKALTTCHAREREEVEKNPELRQSVDPGHCEKTLVVVRGPYQRTKARTPNDPYDDPKVYVYKGSDGGWYDVNGGAPCFAGGTLVETPEGQRAIEDLAVGDAILSWDFVRRRLVTSLVERTKKREDRLVGELTFSDGTTLAVTPNHPFYSVEANAWIEAERLGEGAVVLKLRGSDIEECRLVEKTRFDRKVDVFDVTVREYRDYFAGGILVHNY